MSDKLKQKLEVVLFMAREPLAVEELARFTKSNEEEVRQTLNALVAYYSEELYGIHIIKINDKYQFATKAVYADVLEAYVNAPVEISLSPAALESLAIIAYRQPLTKAEVEAIRGVNSDGIIKSLLDKELIEECGQSDTVGRPTLYGTTEFFLKKFGLSDISELPNEPLKKMQENQETEELLKNIRQKISDIDLAQSEENHEKKEGFEGPISDNDIEDVADDDTVSKSVIEPYEVI